MKAGEIVVQALIHTGIRYVAGVTGDTVLQILEVQVTTGVCSFP